MSVNIWDKRYEEKAQLNKCRPVTKGGSVGSYEPPPPRDHVGPLGPFFLYVFRKLDCHNFSLLFKLHEI